ncbi:MAG: FadR/GntR family transcriptional regulator [Actinomycetota bacterium]
MKADDEGTEALLGPVSSPRLSDVIAERIARLISEGGLRPGERLPTEHELARQLGVGRTSVREGLQKLRTLGMIDVRKGLGAFVAADQIEDPLAEFARWTSAQALAIGELVEARIALEALAAALAALRATDEEIEALGRHHRAHADAPPDLDALVRADEAFHSTVMAASRNQFVTRCYDILIPEITDFRRKTLAVPWSPPRSVRAHEAILEAIRRRDPAAAREAMVDHLYVLYDEISRTAAGRGETGAPPPREALA